MANLDDELRIRMGDGSVWGVPVRAIAEHRAKDYASEFDNDVARSLAEDTEPLFEDDYEVEDWAANNMNWDDVAPLARCVQSAPKPDMQEGWVNGKKWIEEMPRPSYAPDAMQLLREIVYATDEADRALLMASARIEVFGEEAGE